MMLRLLLTFGLLFNVGIASAQMLDEAEREQKLKDYNQQSLDVSIWLQDQGHTRSGLILALNLLSYQENPASLHQVLDAAIQSHKLTASDWHRLARFCREDKLKRSNAGQYSKWCEENKILQKYIKQDSDNAYAYLFQISYNPDEPYNSKHKSLLHQAANAKYANDYYAYGFNSYVTHLREYYRSHSSNTLFWPSDTDTEMIFSNPEDMFIAQFIITGIGSYLAHANQVFGLCRRTYMEKQAGYSESISGDCLQLMELFRTEKNTMMDVSIANSLIGSLSEAGSDKQLEAKRRAITNQLTYQCLSNWALEQDADPPHIVQTRVFIKMLPLLETMGEIQAMAVASDSYFGPHLSAGEQKPSSCLLLKDLDLEVARKLQAEKS